MHPLDAYEALQREFPHLFVPREAIPLVLDRAAQEAFVARTGEALGVLHDTRWLTTVADLIRDPHTGREFVYTRVLQRGAEAGGFGTVVIPRMPDGRLVLIEQQRHPTGAWSLELPRGFAEPGKSAEDLAAIELREEIGCTALRVERVGQAYPDNGILSTLVSFVLAELDGLDSPAPQETQIRRVVLAEPAEIAAWIASGRITDGFTIQALAFLALRGELGPRGLNAPER